LHTAGGVFASSVADNLPGRLILGGSGSVAATGGLRGSWSGLVGLPIDRVDDGAVYGPQWVFLMARLICSAGSDGVCDFSK